MTLLRDKVEARAMTRTMTRPGVDTTKADTGIAHIPALDGIRGIAILMVLITHYVNPWVAPFGVLNERPIGSALFHLAGLGIYGVDLFFVLSGFLITGILLDSKRKSAFFSTFYARRTLRIFPLYFAYLFLVLVVIRFSGLLGYGDERWAAVQPWWYLTYLANWKSDHGMNDPLLGHMWTLSIEEQFYLIWPLVVFYCSRQMMVRLCVAIIVAAPFMRAGMIGLGYDPEALYRLTLPRVDTLVVGALLAIVIRQDAVRERWQRHATAPALVVAAGLLVIAWLSGGFDKTHPLVMTLGFSLTAAASGLLVFQAAATRGRFARFFEMKALRKVGEYSYGIYVLHFLSLYFYGRLIGWRISLPSAPTPVVLLVGAAVVVMLATGSFALAWVSMRFLERPFLRLKSHFSYDQPRPISLDGEGIARLGTSPESRAERA